MKIVARGETEFKRFDTTMSKLLSVSHDKLQKRLSKEERSKARKKKRKAAKTSAFFHLPAGDA